MSATAMPHVLASSARQQPLAMTEYGVPNVKALGAKPGVLSNKEYVMPSAREKGVLLNAM